MTISTYLNVITLSVNGLRGKFIEIQANLGKQTNKKSQKRANLLPKGIRK